MEAPAKIIVVDDEKRICHNVAKILTKNKYEVTHAVSAQEALEKMAKESFSLLISDIVMPGQNGLELLKMVKKEWPLTKAIMMTAYAATDTAIKAIRLGALDYIPKPFTPDELRSTVEQALTGNLVEAPTTAAEKERIDVIDLDMPFDTDEVSKYTGEDYAARLGRSDMPVVEVKMPEPLENYCEVGNMVCDIFKKLGATCKAGVKTAECPQKKAKKGKARKARGFDSANLIGIDQPFSYEEVVSITGPEYVHNLHQEGVTFLPYEELKKNFARIQAKETVTIDVDMPFDRDEVARQTGDDYAQMLTRSDVPVVKVTVPESLENYCEVGSMVCDIFKKLGATCKAGTKSGACPQKKAKKSKAKKAGGFDSKTLIGIDQPFNYEEVAAVTGPEYIHNLHHEDLVVTPYEVLKKEMTRRMATPAERVPADQDLMKEPGYKNILVIDDEVAVNNNIRKILAKNDYHVDQAVTKAEALEKIEARPYNLILLDLKIPGVKGLELLKAVRDKNPEAKVIVITGYASIETAVESARQGAMDYLPKPFTPDEIRSVTDNAFRIAA
ncbi:MAG: response regulator [Desulfobacteraceae bacterium]|jgi:DNA-binding response OmpR family regulator|nr:response regulator [Desulfobacteraceae bacterium]